MKSFLPTDYGTHFPCHEFIHSCLILGHGSNQLSSITMVVLKTCIDISGIYRNDLLASKEINCLICQCTPESYIPETEYEGDRNTIHFDVPELQPQVLLSQAASQVSNVGGHS